MLAAGTRLGPYTIVALLGSGGMGEVYRARDERLNREVAVKVLPPRLSSSADALARFEREARSIAALSHPNIPAIHDVGVDGGVAFSVTELLEGQTLQDRLARSPLPWRRAADVGAAIADGLAAAHAKGVVHRDLKPANIFLTADGRVKILDFGLARVADAAAAPDAPTLHVGVTDPGVVLGTVGYMSPEQARGKPVDARTDLFSLGCVLYEMVTGRRAFVRETGADTLAAILHEEPPDISAAGVDIPAAIDRVIVHCLEKELPARFHSAHDVAFALRAAVTGSDAERPAGKSTAGSRAVPLVAAFTLLAVAGAVWFAARTRPETTRAAGAATDPIRSIAVLPFGHAAGDHDAEFLSYAVTLALSNSLAQLRDVEVRPHSSVSVLAPEIARDARAAGRKLDVQAVLTGTIQARNDDLLISCELVDVGSNSVRWGQVFNRKQADLVAVQEELARTIAGELRVRLTGEDQRRLTRRQTEDRKALELFVLGRREWNKYSEAGFRKSIEYYEQAIDRDPAFALAYSGLADSYIQLAFITTPPMEGMPRAKEYAEKALALDVTLAEAHVSLGTYDLFYELDLRAARREIDEAIARSPNYADAYHFLSHYYQAAARPDDAINAIERAQKLDPTSLVINSEVGMALYLARRYDDALRQYRRGLAIDPDFAPSLIGSAEALVALGRHDEAVQAAQKAVATDQQDALALVIEAYTYATAKRRADAETVLSTLRSREPGRFGMPIYQAAVLMALGRKDDALRALEDGFDRRDLNMFNLKIEPKFDPFRSDLRFQRLLRRFGPV